MSTLGVNPSAESSSRSTRFLYSAVKIAMLSVILGMAVLGASQTTAESPKATKDRMNSQAWWPTKGTLSLSAFAGENLCRKCHSEQASSQPHTPMAEASFRIAQGDPQSKPAEGTMQSGPYRYRISSNNAGSKLTATSGQQSVSADITWIFGAGVHGQTYILEDKGSLYESQVSTFTGLHGMDLTPGHSPIEAGDLKNALGEHLSRSAATLCFGCHTTNSSTDSRFDASRAIPGVRCEACHGPGLDHVIAQNDEQVIQGANGILNPARLNPVDSVDFCGACHRTSMDVVSSPEAYGPINVRFQPYRLEKSRCWGTQGDSRLTCIVCHDPHKPLDRNEGSYDVRCLSCHDFQGSESLGATPSRAVCPKARTNCTTCHMPKVDVPGMHAKFTDHFIRIVRAGESYPN